MSVSTSVDVQRAHAVPGDHKVTNCSCVEDSVLQMELRSACIWCWCLWLSQTLCSLSAASCSVCYSDSVVGGGEPSCEMYSRK